MSTELPLPIDPSQYRRGDTVELTYDSKSHNGKRITREAVVWGTFSDELHLVVESFDPPPHGRNDTFDLYVQPDGHVVNYENRNRKDGNYSRVPRGEDAMVVFVAPVTEDAR